VHSPPVALFARHVFQFFDSLLHFGSCRAPSKIKLFALATFLPTVTTVVPKTIVQVIYSAYRAWKNTVSVSIVKASADVKQTGTQLRLPEPAEPVRNLWDHSMLSCCSCLHRASSLVTMMSRSVTFREGLEGTMGIGAIRSSASAMRRACSTRAERSTVKLIKLTPHLPFVTRESFRQPSPILPEAFQVEFGLPTLAQPRASILRQDRLLLRFLGQQGLAEEFPLAQSDIPRAWLQLSSPQS